MISKQTFSSCRFPTFLRTHTGNIFLEVLFFVKPEILNCRLVASEKRDRSPNTFLKLPKFQNILDFLSSSRKESIVEFLIRQEAAKCSLAILLKGNSTTYIQNTLMRASVMAFRRALGCRIQFCVFLKRDCSRHSS